ncbi:MAG: hypothetical protein QOD93_674 [Acetobacteraceae bacterium]|jgi:hypothetical protein|nr:hypothetical protein [Acetobacteraceae bacterium]MEA2767712.1 hypothetical protein [Acetobacteraceae bacterium]
MRKTLFAAAAALVSLSAGSISAAPAAYTDPLDPPTLIAIGSQYTEIRQAFPNFGGSGRLR